MLNNHSFLFLVIVVQALVIVFLFSQSDNSEKISTQDYRQASLQYLEDIRNSNDIIIQQNEYYNEQSINRTAN